MLFHKEKKMCQGLPIGVKKIFFCNFFNYFFFLVAPEIILGNSPTTQSDIWSIGATVIELLTG